MTAAWVSAAAAVAAIIVGRWPGRWLWRLARRTMDFLDDWAGEPSRPGVPARPGVMERIQNVEQIATTVLAETRPNGGSSLRDVVHQTAADVADVKKDVADVKTEQAAVRRALTARQRGRP